MTTRPIAAAALAAAILPAGALAYPLPFQVNVGGSQSVTGIMDFGTSPLAYSCGGIGMGDPSGFCYGGESWTDRSAQIDFAGGAFDLAGGGGGAAPTLFSDYSGTAHITLSYNEDGDIEDCAWTAECESMLLSFEAYAPELGESRLLTFSVFQRTAELFVDGFDPVAGLFDVSFLAPPTDLADAEGTAADIPAPAGIGLLGAGLVAAGLLRQRRKKAAAAGG